MDIDIVAQHRHLDRKRLARRAAIHFHGPLRPLSPPPSPCPGLTSMFDAPPSLQPIGAQAEAVQLALPPPAEAGPAVLRLRPVPGRRDRLHRRGAAPLIPCSMDLSIRSSF